MEEEERVLYENVNTKFNKYWVRVLLFRNFIGQPEVEHDFHLISDSLQLGLLAGDEGQANRKTQRR